MSERKSMCPGAKIYRLGQVHGRRMPCDRETLPGAGRCGPCAALERQNRAELKAQRQNAQEGPKRSRREDL